MENLGNWLKGAREAKGISLREVESVTRIRVRYLEALEVGDYAVMPGGEPQVRGFLRRYAAFLGLSSEEAVARYNQDVHGGRPQPVVSAPRPMPPLSTDVVGVTPTRRYLRMFLAVAAIIVLSLVAWWLLTRGRSDSDVVVEPSPQATQEMTEAVPTEDTPEAMPTSVPEETSVSAPIVPADSVTLTLEPVEHVWVRVTVDGFATFEGMMAPAVPQTWVAEEMVLVETGNGAALIAMVNGQSEGFVGGRGELSARGWTPGGEVEVPLPAVPTSAADDSS
jgi:cytoskeletal protein RodZ